MARYLIGNIKGPAGEEGFSPTAKVTQTSTGATISITDKNGTTTANIRNGVDGDGNNIDLSPYATHADVNLLQQEIQDAGYATETYVDEKVDDVYIPVTSVNGMTGDVVISTPQQDLSSYASISYVDTKLSDKQDTLTAGNNIQIVDNVISAVGGQGETYGAGEGINITTDGSGNKFIVNAAPEREIEAGAGINVDIDPITEKYVISSAQSGAYTAGTGIDITNNIISSTVAIPTNVSAFQNDANYVTLNTMNSNLANKQDKLTAGDNITISNGIISASGGGGTSNYDNWEDDCFKTSELTKVGLDGWIKEIKNNNHIYQYIEYEEVTSYSTNKHLLRYTGAILSDGYVDYTYTTIDKFNATLAFSPLGLFIRVMNNNVSTVKYGDLAVDAADVKLDSAISPSGSVIDIPSALSYYATKLDLANYTETADLSTVATTGDYDDLTNKPTIPVLPTLATVATTGSYNDLSNKPTITEYHAGDGIAIEMDADSGETFIINTAPGVEYQVGDGLKIEEDADTGAKIIVPSVGGGLGIETDADTGEAAIVPYLGNGLGIEVDTDGKAQIVNTAPGTTYTAGDGIEIDRDEISVDPDAVAFKVMEEDHDGTQSYAVTALDPVGVSTSWNNENDEYIKGSWVGFEEIGIETMAYDRDNDEWVTNQSTLIGPNKIQLMDIDGDYFDISTTKGDLTITDENGDTEVIATHDTVNDAVNKVSNSIPTYNAGDGILIDDNSLGVSTRSLKSAPTNPQYLVSVNLERDGGLGIGENGGLQIENAGDEYHWYNVPLDMLDACGIGNIAQIKVCSYERGSATISEEPSFLNGYEGQVRVVLLDENDVYFLDYQGSEVDRDNNTVYSWSDGGEWSLTNKYDENGRWVETSLVSNTIFITQQIEVSTWEPQPIPAEYLPDYYTKSEVDDLLDEKQDALTAGTGIDITNGVISATGSGSGGTSYTAGNNITIDNNEISLSNNVAIMNTDNENYYDNAQFSPSTISVGHMNPTSGQSSNVALSPSGQVLVSWNAETGDPGFSTSINSNSVTVSDNSTNERAVISSTAIELINDSSVVAAALALEGWTRNDGTMDSMLHVSGGTLYAANGIYLDSTDGNHWLLGVDNNGNLTTTKWVDTTTPPDEDSPEE